MLAIIKKLKKAYPNINTEFNKNVDKKIISIIKKYWNIKNKSFTTTPTKLRTQLNITQSSLNKIVKDNSKSILFIDECIECSKPIKIEVTVQSTAKKIIERNDYQCEKCKNNFIKQHLNLDYKAINILRVDYAFKYKLWEKLNSSELNILKKIMLSEDSIDFIHTLKIYSPIIQKLNKFKLIDIQKDLDDRIENVYYSSKLKHLFFRKTETENHRLEYALKNELWNTLSTYEFDILKEIIRLNNYSKIYTKLYKEKESFKKNWPIIAKLDRLGLIKIIKDSTTNKIIEFNFSQALSKILELNTNNQTTDLNDIIHTTNNQNKKYKSEPKKIGDIIKRLTRF